MTSKTTYNNIIRPTWFDIHGELLPWARKRLYNGNWDTYLDFRVEGMECIYPTIPSIVSFFFFFLYGAYIYIFANVKILIRILYL